MSIATFIKTLSKDHRVAALMPTSRFVAQRIAREVGLSNGVVVEYGAGDGAVTRALLSAMSPDSRLVAIELNSDFIAELKKITDPRLVVIAGDVVEISDNLARFGPIDVIVSGIPFSLFDSQVRERIIVNSYNALGPRGKIVLYQVSLLMSSCLQKVFSQKIRWFFEPRNLPPYWIMVGKK